MDRFAVYLDNIRCLSYLNAMENTPVTRNDLVIKSNALINAMIDIGLQGMRLLAYAASRIPPGLVIEKGRPVDIEVSVPEMAETFEMNPDSAYREIKALADRLMKKIIEFEDDGAQIGVGLLSKRKYISGEGRLLLRFDEDLVPHLMGLKENFTKYRIKDVYQFQRASTWRVYELLRQYKQIGKREFDIDELKSKIGVAGLYPIIADLRRRILDPAIEEINATSDIKAAYEQMKRGKRIVKILFIIRENMDTKSAREKATVLSKAGLGNKPRVPNSTALYEKILSTGVDAPDAARLAWKWEGREEEAYAHIASIEARARDGKIKKLPSVIFSVLKKESEKIPLPTD